MPDSEPLTELAFAAESGDVNAQYRMGVLFLLGGRVEQDLKAAHRWFQAAAANGSGPAEVMRQTTSQVCVAQPVAVKRGPILVFALPLLGLLSLSIHSGYQYSKRIQGSPSIHAQEQVSDPAPATAKMVAFPEPSLASVNEPIAQAPSAGHGTIPRELPVVRHHYKGRHRK
jgi:TPR repeat protein